MVTTGRYESQSRSLCQEDTEYERLAVGDDVMFDGKKKRARITLPF